MFNHIKHEIDRPFAQAEHTEDGHYYRTNEGKLYPSITTVFKELDDKSWYPYWVAKVMRDNDMTETEAEVECKRIGSQSLQVGNELHRIAEEYLNNGGSDTDYKENQYEIDPNTLGVLLKSHLDGHVTSIHGVEKQIYSDELGVAGTADLIAEYDGVLSVIDFKNSRKPKTNSECKKKKYYEQVCAYGKMWEQCTGEIIKQGIVLVVSWDGKVKPFKVHLPDYEEDLWLDLARFEQKKALNTI